MARHAAAFTARPPQSACTLAGRRALPVLATVVALNLGLGSAALANDQTAEAAVATATTAQASDVSSTADTATSTENTAATASPTQDATPANPAGASDAAPAAPATTPEAQAASPNETASSATAPAATPTSATTTDATPAPTPETSGPAAPAAISPIPVAESGVRSSDCTVEWYAATTMNAQWPDYSNTSYTAKILHDHAGAPTLGIFEVQHWLNAKGHQIFWRIPVATKDAIRGAAVTFDLTPGFNMQVSIENGFNYAQRVGYTSFPTVVDLDPSMIDVEGNHVTVTLGDLPAGATTGSIMIVGTIPADVDPATASFQFDATLHGRYDEGDATCRPSSSTDTTTPPKTETPGTTIPNTPTTPETQNPATETPGTGDDSDAGNSDTDITPDTTPDTSNPDTVPDQEDVADETPDGAATSDGEDSSDSEAPSGSKDDEAASDSEDGGTTPSPDKSATGTTTPKPAAPATTKPAQSSAPAKAPSAQPAQRAQLAKTGSELTTTGPMAALSTMLVAGLVVARRRRA